MKKPNDFDRAVRTWLDAEGTWKAPPELLRAVSAEAHARRPRPRWLATIRRDGAAASPPAAIFLTPRVLAFVALALLLVAIIAAAVIGAGSRSPQLAVEPTPMPTLQHSMTVDEVTQVVLAELNVDQVGLAIVPPHITKVTLVAPNGSYDFGAGLENIGSSALTWVVEVQGTFVICSSFCDERDAETFLVGDADAQVGGTRGNPAHTTIFNIPSTAFRQLLADHGLLWTAAPVPTAGVVPAATIVQGLDPRLIPSSSPIDPTPSRDGPMYGLISVVNPSLAQSGSPLPVAPVAGTRAIWWVAAMGPFPKPGGGGYAWAAFDAVTGEQLLTGSS
ncbi:MAG: hypothetical protein QOI92_1264 [Chloroflexota bacterium]|nr:hypothetical protein [Chloroflexota bacterium]